MLVDFLLLVIFLNTLQAVDIDYEDLATVRAQTDFDFEPVNPLVNRTTEIPMTSNIQCEDFEKYSNDCTQEATAIYDLNRNGPPKSDEIEDWCQALQISNKCASSWNADCKDVDEHIYNEETIKGQQYVISSICNNSQYLDQYLNLSSCIDSTYQLWRVCYEEFRKQIEKHKNSTNIWTHYITHFYLCCARATFRRCTLETILSAKGNCGSGQILHMQKFFVILSEGEVFQDCNRNMMYSNCPGGDPRPMAASLYKGPVEPVKVNVKDSARTARSSSVCSTSMSLRALLVIILTEL